MSDILQEIKELKEFFDNQDKIDTDILAMFELSGYELNHEEFDEDGELINSRAKTVEELVRELLNDPPKEPQKWIKISDIPRYINDYLIVPEREKLDEWNSKVHPGAFAPVALTPEEPKEPERTVNDKGELDPDFKKTGEVFTKAGQVPSNTTIVDAIGVIWHKKAPNQWFEINDDDPIAAQEPYWDQDITPMGPLEEIITK